MKISKLPPHKRAHRKRLYGGFKLAECVSKMDMAYNTTASKYIFFFVLNRLMEVRDNEIARS